MSYRRQTRKYWRQIFGLPPKKKIRTTKIRRLAKTPKIKKIKYLQNNSITPLEQGFKTGQILVSAWNSQKNPPKVYFSGYRIHHGLVGALLVAFGILSENNYTIGLGASLAIDDLHDIGNWLDFETQTMQSYNALPELNYINNFV